MSKHVGFRVCSLHPTGACADAVIQATGAVLFFAGLASGQDELVRSDLETGLRVTPRAVGSTGFGVGFDGRF